MDVTTGFFKPYLNVFYKMYYLSKRTTALKDVNETNYKDASSCYRLLYIIDGKSIVRLKNGKVLPEKNVLVIAKPHSVLDYEFDAKEGFEYIFIDIHPKMFRNEDIGEDFLKPFLNNDNDSCMYDLNEKECEFLKQILDSFPYLLSNHYNEAHIKSRILAIVSELGIIYNKKYHEVMLETDSLGVKMIEYIGCNYTRKITYQELSEKFFISVPTVNKIIRKFTGRPLTEFVNYLRLDDAKKLLDQQDLTLSKIAELCGFGNYSSFYRAYVKQYGVPPAKSIKRNVIRWPLDFK